jgi:hypothetical protein
VIFADGGGRAHAPAVDKPAEQLPAVRAQTRTVLIVAEVLHASALADMQRLVAAVGDELDRVWSAGPRTGVLTSSSPHFGLDEIT